MDKNISEQTRCISHEIRNQLSVCELYTQIIRKHLENEGVNNHSVFNALSCIEKSVKLISNSLLDLKLLNNFELKTCELNSVLEQAINLSEVYSVGKKIEIVFLPSVNCLVNIDENKFIACAVNILKNAVEAIENVGEIKVISEVFDNYISVKFINNGNQIPLEKQANVFEKEFTTKITGCGLGLYICRDNLQRMNADLRLNYSNKDATEFEITLPVA